MKPDELKRLLPVHRCLVEVAEVLGWHTQMEGGTVLWRNPGGDVWYPEAPLQEIVAQVRKKCVNASHVEAVRQDVNHVATGQGGAS